MTAAVAESAGRGAAWPGWVPPAGAVEAWVALTAAVGAMADRGRRTPCSSAPDAWFPRPGEAALIERAVAGCLVCPVARLCGAYAEAAGERHGVWGATTPEGRVSRARPVGTR